MKRVISVLLSVLLLCPCITCFAAESAEVYAEKTYAKSNSVFFIPVYVKNNPGLMGFKITLTYDPKVITYPNISRGTVTQAGNFNDSIGASNDGTIDVVWNSDSDITDDGTLFVVSFNTDEVTVTETTIKLEYSQADTFNEAYDDVKLSCKDLVISFQEKSSETQEVSTAAGRPANSEDIVTAVDNALQSIGVSKLSEVEESRQDEIVSMVNDRLRQVTGSDEDTFMSSDELKSTYLSAIQEVYVDSVLSCIDPAEIEKAMNSALGKAGMQEIPDANDKNADVFVETFVKEISKMASDVFDVDGKLSTENMLKAVQDIQDGCDNEMDGEIIPLVEETPHYYTNVKIVLLSIISLIVIVAGVYIILRRKKRHEA